jgi:hypothetical protein
MASPNGFWIVILQRSGVNGHQKGGRTSSELHPRQGRPGYVTGQ